MLIDFHREKQTIYIICSLEYSIDLLRFPCLGGGAINFPKFKLCSFNNNLHMTDHAGPRRCEFHPGTNFWHPPIEVTQSWHPRNVLAPFFCKAIKIILIKRRGKKYETKICWKWFKFLFCFILMNLFLFGLSKM